MPVHQDPEQQLSKAYKQEDPLQRHVNTRRLSEESIRTEYCDGPVPDIAIDNVVLPTGEDGRVSKNGEAICSDRAELIERIKRGESPTWIPNQAVSQGPSTFENTHSRSLGMVQIYIAMDFATQTLEDDWVVSLCSLERFMSIRESNASHVLYLEA